MEILDVIWQAFLHDLAQMPGNWLTPCILLPLATGVLCAFTRGRVWKPLAVSLILLGGWGLGYCWAGLTRLLPFIRAIEIFPDWDWAWVPCFWFHLIEVGGGVLLRHLMLKRQD